MSHMIPYGKQSISKKDIEAVIKVLGSDFLTQGPEIIKFEKIVTKYLACNYATAVSSATSGLHIACLALGLGKKDIVWTSTNSFVATSNAVLFTGAKIDFIDIDETNNICIKNLKTKLELAKLTNSLPSVVIPVHIGGLSCNMKELKSLSEIYGFKIIEDASHCIGGDYNQNKIGSCEFSDLCVFSFHPVKIITTGEGGMVTTNSKHLSSLLECYRSHGIERDNKKFLNNDVPSWYYEQHYLSHNYRMTDIQAALGSSQMLQLDKKIMERRKIATFYKKSLKNYYQLTSNDIESSSNHLFILKTKKRDKLRDFLIKQKIMTSLHYFPIHLQPYYQDLGFRAGDFPVAEDYGRTAISIPIYPELEQNQIDHIVESLIKFKKSN